MRISSGKCKVTETKFGEKCPVHRKIVWLDQDCDNLSLVHTKRRSTLLVAYLKSIHDDSIIESVLTKMEDELLTHNILVAEVRDVIKDDRDRELAEQTERNEREYRADQERDRQYEAQNKTK